MMHYWDAYWGLRVAECPCDVHFTDWLTKTGVRGATIYHFGTGGHHHVGLVTAGDGSDNAVIGITASPEEYNDYVKLVIEKPEVGRSYKAYFGDIYQVDPRTLPELDVVTLFHLCEFRSEKNDAYGALTDLGVAEVLTDRLRPGGRVLFYTGSFAFAKAEPVIAELAASRSLVREADFETLQVYRKPA